MTTPDEQPDELAEETEMASPDSDEILSLSASGSHSSGGSSRYGLNAIQSGSKRVEYSWKEANSANLMMRCLKVL